MSVGRRRRRRIAFWMRCLTLGVWLVTLGLLAALPSPDRDSGMSWTVASARPGGR